MLGQQFTRSGDHSCDKGQISTDHQLFWSLIKSTDDLWSTCDRLEPQSGELSPDPRKYSAKNGFWCNPRSSLIRERCWKSAVSMQLKEFYVGYQSVVFLLSICPAENISISLRPKTSFCAGVMIEMGPSQLHTCLCFVFILGCWYIRQMDPPLPPPNGQCLYQSLRLLVIAFDSIILLPLIFIVNLRLHPLYVKD